MPPFGRPPPGVAVEADTARPTNAPSADPAHGVVLGLILPLLMLVGSCTPEGKLSWEVSFECEQDALNTETVLLDISEGECPGGSEPVYQAAIARNANLRPSAPGNLPRGAYAFHATALDTRGQMVAEDCVNVALPTAHPVELVLRSNVSCAPVAPIDGGMAAEAGALNDAMAASPMNDAGLAAETKGPRIDHAQTDFIGSEHVVIHYVDVTEPGHPFLGLYEQGQKSARFEVPIPFNGTETVTSGSHDFGALAIGSYDVRLTYDKGKVADSVMISVLSDRDADGVSDAEDGCPDDSRKIAPALCGCGNEETDRDQDGTPDCVDKCPDDALKAAPGTCGCGFLESFLDQDSDGLSDCYDACPGDPAKTKPLQCGCAALETDTDSDGTADCNDHCVDDPSKIEAGTCGCGVPDTDTDADGTADCLDMCAQDALKVLPGVCGCGTPDTDGDQDGVSDCIDLCPADAGKVAPGICGCGTSDADKDKDGTPNCNDACPADPKKIVAGTCGCGVPDTDKDLDGVLDCLDGCPTDPAKLKPLVCGCGKPETDSDQDGILDCLDGCPSDLNKTSTGMCGCGVADTDSDGDGTANCLDKCSSDPTKIAPGKCGCGAAEPVDNTSFRDAKGFACKDWKGYDCTRAAEDWKYTAAQETAIITNCGASCGICPP